MNEKLREKYIQILDSICQSYLNLAEISKSWINDPETGKQKFVETGERLIPNYDVSYAFCIQAINAILEICPENSPYYQEVIEIHSNLDIRSYDFRLYNLLCNLRHDIEIGFIGKMSSLLQREIFIDYLDMARHLLDEGYKDASAVITGSTLESHLRQLCITHQIPIEEIRKDETKRPKKADVLNADLKKNGIYTLYDQKMITAQLDLRNNAAHGKYELYTDDQVANFIDWLTDFIERNPA